MKNKTEHVCVIIIIFMLMVLAGGCKTEEEPQKRTTAALTLVSKDDKEVSASDSSGTSGNSTVGTGTSTPFGNALGNVTTVTPKVTGTVTKNNYVITPVTEGLCEQLPVSELGELAEYNAFNRLERNDKTELMLEHKVCVDDTTGVVYYVNVGRDYFIYRIKDGKSELAVELPANYLYTHEGVLYFLLDAQNIAEGVWRGSYPGRYMYDKFTFEGMSEGDIYSYTPATGKVELVYPAQALRLRVKDEGIYYLKGKLDKNEKYNATGLEWYHIPFDGSEPQKIEDGGMDDVWNDYQYDWSEDTLRLKSEATGEIIELVPDKGYIRSCIFEDKVFAMNVQPAAIPKCIDLLTKEEMFSYNLEEKISMGYWCPSGDESWLLSLRNFQNEFLQRIIESRSIQTTSYAVTDGNLLWFLVQQFIYCINLETGEGQLFYYPPEGTLSRVSQLYTDGKNLYALYYYLAGKAGEEPVFVRLVFEYEEESNVWCWDVTDKIGVND